MGKKTWKEDILEYQKEKQPKEVKKKNKSLSQQCGCGFFLGESNFSNVTKSYFCPICGKTVEKN